MAFLDFIRNRDGQRPAAEQQSQQQKPDVSQDIGARPSERGASAGKAVGQLPEDVRSEARNLGARLNQATRNIQSDAPASPQAPADATDSQQPMRQNMMSQDKPAPDLSPTSAQDGIPMKDVERPGPSAATPARSQDQERQTIARPAPSWER